ncbi:hypothetical protein L1987_89867 [Smallanthus sonchifolius]|nr:hypothetical protein L1987_89867 [Smallanthus sonchifolius]
MFPTYPLVIPMIPRCTYSPQPSVQIYLGYGHCTPIVVSPISASVGGTYVQAGWSGLCPSEFYPRYHKEHCPPATARGYLRSPTEQNGENSRERRDKKGKVLLRLKMRLSLRDPLVIGPPLLAKKERQSSRSDLARGRIEMPIDEVGEASLPAKGDCLLFDENEKGN